MKPSSPMVALPRHRPRVQTSSWIDHLTETSAHATQCLRLEKTEMVLFAVMKNVYEAKEKQETQPVIEMLCAGFLEKCDIVRRFRATPTEKEA
ncbi:hypothetical protein TNCV_396331 [Trichonephila clavipes]|nr:hypothetical protein TNCV_396331 [Trichonephila clavipes]